MITIHTLGWKFDHAVRADEDPMASIFCRVFIDDVEIPGVMRARTRHSGDDFSLTQITLFGPVEVVNHTQDSWDGLPKAEL